MNTFRRFRTSGMGLIISLIIITALAWSAHASRALASGHISVWWPVNNATLASVQPFKALVDGVAVEDYSMYWQVDGGVLNPMGTNYADAPHKEASVDVTNWKWQSSGAYNVNFVAKDGAGNTVAVQPVTILANQSSIQPAAPSLPAPIPAPAPAPASAPVAPVVVAVPTMSIWWPTEGANISGTQPFKALVDNRSVSSYKMYWSVDGGVLNLMGMSNTDAPHMESSVNLTGWNWHGAGPYAVSFIAKDSAGVELVRKTVHIYNAGANTTPTAPVTAPIVVTPVPVTVTPAPVIPNPVISAPVILTSTPVAGNPLSGMSLYVDPNNSASKQAIAWRTSRPADAAEMDKIGIEPVAKWFGDWNSNISGDVKAYVDAATAKGEVPVMVLYNIPERDCGGYSAGSTDASAYTTWIQGVASGIGSRRAVVMLEPDSLALISCLSSNDLSTRYNLLNNAVSTLKSLGHTSVYMDAGNSNWISAPDMATRLTKAGVSKADGFALNVSNFYPTTDSLAFGQSLSALVGGKHFVVDTSRNGLGSNGGEWCNPLGRSLGLRPTSSTGNSLADAFLWIKTPGESDGNCNGGPSAGVWWPDYALGLAQRATY